jgi:hypothetical protein
VPKEAKACRACIHCRVQGDEADGTRRVWCRMGMWKTAAPTPDQQGHLFHHTTLRAVLRNSSQRLIEIARSCPYFNREPDDEWPVKFVRKPT